MRSRVSRRRLYLWARPALTGTDEPLREMVYDRQLAGAAYPLPASERRTLGGIRREGGALLVLPPDSGLRPGDRLRPALTPEETYEVTETRAYPAHAEAVLRLCSAEDRPEEDGNEG